MTAFEESLRRCCDLVDILSGDVRRHIAESDNQDDAFTRRGFVRCVCAYIEGVAHVMKQAALIMSANSEGVFTAAELLLLSDRAPDLKENGNVIEKRAKLLTLANVRFAFLSFARAQHVALEIDFIGEEWARVKRAFEIRDKLMHPKSVHDLEIAEADANMVLMAGEWIHESFLTLMGQTAAKPRVATMTKTLVESPTTAV
jgi:hypothetical protein